MDTWGWHITEKRYFMQQGRDKKTVTYRFNYKWDGNHKDPFVTEHYNEQTWPKNGIDNYEAAKSTYQAGMRWAYGVTVKPATWETKILACGKTTSSSQYSDPCPWASIRETYLHTPAGASASGYGYRTKRGAHLIRCDISELPAGYAGKFDDDIHVELRPMRQFVPDGVRERYLGVELDSAIEDYSALGPNSNQADPDDALNYDARVNNDYEIRGFEHNVVGQALVREERWKVMATYNDTGDSNYNGMWRYKIVESNIETNKKPRKNKEIMYDPVANLGGIGVPSNTYYRKLHLIPDDYVGGSYSTSIEDGTLVHNYDPAFGS